MKNTLKTNLLFIFFIFLPLIITLILLPYMPDIIPAHYGINGIVNRYGSKYELLILPIITIILCFGIRILTIYIAKKQENINNQKQLIISNIIVVSVFNVLTYIFLFTSYINVHNIEATTYVKLPTILAGIAFIIVGNYIPKTKRNTFVGIRTASTMKDDEVWVKTNRLGGKILMIFSFLFVLLAFILPVYLANIILITFFILLIVYLSKYSKKLYIQKKQ